MKLWTAAGRRSDARGSVTIVDEREAVAASARDQLGVLPCSARGCREQTGIACAYIDRRGRPCQTAWCPAHRAVAGEAGYCPGHAQIVGASAEAFGVLERPDIDNPVPQLVVWVARQLEAHLCALMQPLCIQYGQAFVADPLRMNFLGIDRVRTWECAWKMSSHVGNTLRVHVGVAEAHPDAVVVRVNSNVVATIAPPPPRVRELADEPDVTGIAQVETFRSALLAAIHHGVAVWKAGYHEQSVGIELTGLVQSIAEARSAGALQLRE